MIHWMLLMNAQGRTRLDKWYDPYNQKERLRIKKEMLNTVLRRPPRSCNFVQWNQYTVVYKRFASLFVLFCIDQNDNELLALEMIQFFIECLDSHFGDVCELDLIFCFDQAYQILDECFMAGEMQESSKRHIRNIVKEAFVPIDDPSEKDVDDFFNIFG